MFVCLLFFLFVFFFFFVWPVVRLLVVRSLFFFVFCFVIGLFVRSFVRLFGCFFVYFVVWLFVCLEKKQIFSSSIFQKDDYDNQQYVHIIVL